MTDLIQADKQARQLRRQFSPDVFPVDVAMIAKCVGIRVERLPLDDDLSGMAFIKGGNKVIVVNKYHHINRRRFTIAHELGHHCLHSSYLTNNVHVDKVVLRRDQFSSEGVDDKERQANAFAAELLMPASELRKWAKVDINDDITVAMLAKKLRVSTAALTFRLTNLGHTAAAN